MSGFADTSKTRICEVVGSSGVGDSGGGAELATPNLLRSARTSDLRGVGAMVSSKSQNSGMPSRP